MKRIPLVILILACASWSATTTTAGTPVRVTEIRSEKSPLVTFRIVLRAGSINDVKEKEGVNALTALMIAQGGTRDQTYQDVVATLYPWAAGIGVQPDKEITTFVGNVHRDHLDRFYAILSGLLLNPRFDPDDFTRNKDLMLNALEKNLRGTDDENLGKDAMLISLFRDHPYGTAGATVQGLKNTTLEDVKEYYRKTYTTGNIWIGLAGGYPASLVERVKRDFSALPEGKFTPVTLPPPRQPSGLEIDLIEKPARAVAISMGHPLTVTRKDKDFYALMVANSYFGEHRTFNGVLMKRIRGDRGLNYGSYSYIERFLGGVSSGSRFPEVNTPLRHQYFSIWLRPVQPGKAHFAVRAALYELDRFVEQGLTNEEFEKARKFLLNYSKLWAQTLDRRLGYAMDAEFYGLTEDYIQRIDRELHDLTVDDVNTAIRRHISAENLQVAMVVHDATVLKQAIVTNTPSPITYESSVDQSILDADKLIAVFPLRVNTGRTRVVPVETLFENESPAQTARRREGIEK